MAESNFFKNFCNNFFAEKLRENTSGLKISTRCRLKLFVDCFWNFLWESNINQWLMWGGSKKSCHMWKRDLWIEAFKDFVTHWIFLSFCYFWSFLLHHKFRFEIFQRTFAKFFPKVSTNKLRSKVKKYLPIKVSNSTQ